MPAGALARLRLSPALGLALADPRLRRLLAMVDGAPDRARALDAALQAEGPRLQALCDDMLLSVGAAEVVGEGEGGEGGKEGSGKPGSELVAHKSVEARRVLLLSMDRLASLREEGVATGEL